MTVEISETQSSSSTTTNLKAEETASGTAGPGSHMNTATKIDSLNNNNNNNNNNDNNNVQEEPVIIDSSDATAEGMVIVDNDNNNNSKNNNINNEPFISSKRYTGSKDGYYFGTGDNGTGYYIDKIPSSESLLKDNITNNNNEIEIKKEEVPVVPIVKEKEILEETVEVDPVIGDDVYTFAGRGILKEIRDVDNVYVVKCTNWRLANNCAPIFYFQSEEVKKFKQPLKMSELTTMEMIDKAVGLKEKGNELFKKKDIENAAQRYGEACAYIRYIGTSQDVDKLDPETKARKLEAMIPLFNNMANCKYRLKDFNDAISASMSAFMLTDALKENKDGKVMIALRKIGITDEQVFINWRLKACMLHGKSHLQAKHFGQAVEFLTKCLHILTHEINATEKMAERSEVGKFLETAIKHHEKEKKKEKLLWSNAFKKNTEENSPTKNNNNTSSSVKELDTTAATATTTKKETEEEEEEEEEDDEEEEEESWLMRNLDSIGLVIGLGAIGGGLTYMFLKRK